MIVTFLLDGLPILRGVGAAIRVARVYVWAYVLALTFACDPLGSSYYFPLGYSPVNQTSPLTVWHWQLCELLH